MTAVIANWTKPIIAEPIAEKTTFKLTGVLKDEAGVAISSASLTTLTLTLYPKATPATKINSRDAQNVLNANGVTVDMGGYLVWTASPADNVIMDAALTEETHMALFEFTWSAGAKDGKHLIEFTVINLPTVS
jgi:hypothetical protein